MPVPTFEQIEQKVRELANESPDFVYDKGDNVWCKYNADGIQPGCIFGQAFTALGFPVPMLHNTDPIEEVLVSFYISVTREQEKWASRVQGSQDRGNPWGDAIKEADAAPNF